MTITLKTHRYGAADNCTLGDRTPDPEVDVTGLYSRLFQIDGVIDSPGQTGVGVMDISILYVGVPSPKSTCQNNMKTDNE